MMQVGTVVVVWDGIKTHTSYFHCNGSVRRADGQDWRIVRSDLTMVGRSPTGSHASAAYIQRSTLRCDLETL